MRIQSIALCVSCAAACGALHIQRSQASAPLAFERQQLTADYLSEGAAVGDFNRDGQVDIVAGPMWFEGPAFVRSHLIWKSVVHSTSAYSFDSFFSFVDDFDSDGWDDVLVVAFPGLPAFWYRNPAGAGGVSEWTRHAVLTAVDMESPNYVDVDGDGRRELLCAQAGSVGYAEPGATPTSPWTFRAITPPGPWTAFVHGLGAGDVDSDGRVDVLTVAGWFEQPAAGAATSPWLFHPFLFSTAVGGAQMYTVDVDGDGDADVVTSLNAHGYGLSWFEHIVLPNGAIGFIERPVMTQAKAPSEAKPFSQLHAVAVADLDGDGLRDIVTGKTYRAHNGADPGALDPAVVTGFVLGRAAGGPQFKSIAIDGDAGIGRQVTVADVNRDGRADVVTANKKGVFVFRQR